MKKSERIAQLEREVAELKRRLMDLELKKALAPLDPQRSPYWPNPPPWRLPWWARNNTGPGCTCPPGTICGNVACPRRSIVTSTTGNDYTSPTSS